MRTHPSPHRRALAAAGVALALLAGACSGDDATADPPTTDAPPTTETTDAPAADATGAADPLGPPEPAAHASLDEWEQCDDDLDCAFATVPLDWAEPEGETIDLFLVRLPATGEARGTLFVNPGGPGASGVDLVAGGAPMFEGLRGSFDVVGWDPRGVDGSEGITCRTPEQREAREVDIFDPDSIEEVRAEAEAFQEGCEVDAGPLLTQVGTRSTVRDLDALRGLVGDDQLTYLGYSYGTTIGLEYLRTYPDRVRAMVLDGVAVPGQDLEEAARIQAEGFERTLGAYLDGCTDRPTCPLGDDPLAELLALRDGLADDPAPARYGADGTEVAAREGEVGRAELLGAITHALYSEELWEILDLALDELLAPTPAGDTALMLRDDYLGREADGSWTAMFDALEIITCADQAGRAPDISFELAPWAEDLPFFGPVFGIEGDGCFGHPEAVEPLEPMAPGSITGVPPVVLVGVTNDPATPYEQTAVAQDIVEGSIHVTYEGDQHTVFLHGDPCIDEPLVTYLVEGTPPEDGLTC